ncbi:hypothetical protein VW29_10440 [Devosia limi DSM 17137]|uniref:Uncharacterized protein n=1 Tax=Devosia limi DSM 17137 TaxID=1121477 RepID=A0A0F5LQF2_9HYPH|nr:hypothetical protein [Devosia limi]KKB84374.1 hypothetical protein VW29_10440 [Devosia limi DSM 17137]SHF62413.1 hypothetical protein SAMN02745223_03149 [Devosia limi DSM 17137]
MGRAFFQAAFLALAVGLVSSGTAFVVATSPVLALERNEAAAVVSIMEELVVEMGEGMTVDAADIFYDYDSLGASLIPAVGFDLASWSAAYHAVASGYMASMPQMEFDAVFEGPLAQLEAAELPEDQKAMIREHVDLLIAEAQALRLSGMPFVEVVQPFADRLHVLFHGAFSE